MDMQREGGRAAGARPIALLDTWGMACGYAVPDGGTPGRDTAPDAVRGKPATDDDEVPAGLCEVLDGALRIAVVLLIVAGTFAVSFYAPSAIIRR